MGWSFRSVKSLPDRYSIIGCSWPLDEVPDAPGEKVRPCLVGDTRNQFDEELKIEYGVVTVSYGTKQGTDSQRDMVIGPNEYRKTGLDYPTRFSMDRIEEFVWCKEWFPSRRYFANQIVYFGCLDQHQIDRFNECLSRFRGS